MTKLLTPANPPAFTRIEQRQAWCLIRGKSNPRDFAAALQNSGKFGIDPKTGAKVPTYVSRVAETIQGLRAIIGRRKI